MQLGDFFTAAHGARPVNPRAVKFTAVAKGAILPGGTSNPSKKAVATVITAGFVFLDGDGAAAANKDMRKALRERFTDAETGIATPWGTDDENLELTYQLLWRVLYEYNSKDKTAGDRMFPDVGILRELVVPPEANRVLSLYNKYVKEEHPEDLEAKPFRGAEGGGAGVAVASPGR